MFCPPKITLYTVIVSWYGNTTVDLQYRIAGHFREVQHFACFDGRAVNAKIKTGIKTPTKISRYSNLIVPLPQTAPVRSPDDYRFVRSHPEGCSRADCNVFIGIDTNAGDDRFLDIYMEGTAEGWVAVGFSDSPNMVNV